MKVVLGIPGGLLPANNCFQSGSSPLQSGLLCFGSWHAIIVDGHSVEELCKALSQPRHQPLAIIARTIKGKGIPGTKALETPSD